MKRLQFYCKLYFSMISQYFMVKMQFRADFFISTLAILLSNITGVFSYWVLFHTISGIEGWNLNELIFFYAFGLLAITPQQLFFDNLWVIRIHIQSGSFIKYYFKPINMLFYYISEVLDIKGFGQLIFALSMLIYSSIKLGIHWTPLSILTFLLLLSSSAVIMISLILMTTSVAFWVVDSVQLPYMIYKLTDFSKYPVTIFNGFFRIFFTAVIPISFLSYYPGKLLLRPSEDQSFMFLTPLVAVILAVIAYSVWCRGVNSYSGTGS